MTGLLAALFAAIDRIESAAYTGHKGKITSFFLLICISLSMFTYFPVPVFATPLTPITWQSDGKLRDWPLDKNVNFVDDRIENQTGRVNVIVDLNRCIVNRTDSELINFLQNIGNITYIGKYVTFVVVSGVDVERTFDIANRPEVAMVELDAIYEYAADNFRAAKIEGSGIYSPNTLQDRFGWPNLLDGRQVNIAFLDSGVGPAYDSNFVHGYNVITNSEENPPPDPMNDHATAMAGWVFGPTGISRHAGLVDIKITLSNSDILRGLEVVIDKHREWNINIVTLMFSGIAAENGNSAISREIDLLSAKGVVVVAGAGTNPCAQTSPAVDNPITGPGAASRAISVSAADIHQTVDRADDTATFVRGPRASDGDQDPLDELKPEVIMTTGEGNTCISNSIATAETSALAALLLQQNPDLRDFDNSASGSVKDLIIRGAEPKGAPSTSINYPRSAPTWNQNWGFGEIDAYEMFTRLTGQFGGQTGRTDLTFIGFDGTSHPSSPWYLSHAVETQSERNGMNIVAGVPDVVFAKIRNNGQQDAHNVRVQFGFYPLGIGIYDRFNDIGSILIPTIRSGEDVIVQIPWTPPILPPGQEHGCIHVSINYGYDSNFSTMSNFAQKNIRLVSSSSPSEFHFQVESPLTSTARVDLIVNQTTGWNITLSENSFTLTPTDCARNITAEIQPTVEVEPGTEAIFYVTGIATPEEGHKPSEDLGGVALRVRIAETAQQVANETIS